MEISKQVRDILDEVKSIRRDLHKIPEIAYEEIKTSEYVIDYLKKLDIDRVENLAGTGVRAVVYAKEPAGTIAFRADIDALPLPEETGLPFASRHEGCMHACGHDAHMAMLLGFAKLVSQNKSSLKKNIVFIFQPAEETDGGAEIMIHEGALKNPDVEEIYGMHLWPDLKAGSVGVKAGPVMARMCDLNIDISGRGAHGAKPQLGIDALVAAGQLIGMLQTIISRSIDPYERAVITVGKIEGGTARNVICEHVRLEGTIRTFKDSVFESLKARIMDILKGLEAAFGVTTEYSETMSYPPVVNPESLVEKATAMIGLKDVTTVKPIMISEDFSYYQQSVPGLFLFLGIADETHTTPLHSGTFDFNEEVMANGVEIFKRLAGI